VKVSDKAVTRALLVSAIGGLPIAVLIQIMCAYLVLFFIQPTSLHADMQSLDTPLAQIGAFLCTPLPWVLWTVVPIAGFVWAVASTRQLSHRVFGAVFIFQVWLGGWLGSVIVMVLLIMQFGALPS